ncbi:MAG TPA: hypothetical protein VNM24_11310 [Burkholderiales bacterium]|nr:hypothetical protein [Burkholderiales bacterium]
MSEACAPAATDIVRVSARENIATAGDAAPRFLATNLASDAAPDADAARIFPGLRTTLARPAPAVAESTLPACFVALAVAPASAERSSDTRRTTLAAAALDAERIFAGSRFKETAATDCTDLGSCTCFTDDTTEPAAALSARSRVRIVASVATPPLVTDRTSSTTRTTAGLPAAVADSVRSRFRRVPKVAVPLLAADRVRSRFRIVASVAAPVLVTDRTITTMRVIAAVPALVTESVRSRVRNVASVAVPALVTARASATERTRLTAPVELAAMILSTCLTATTAAALDADSGFATCRTNEAADPATATSVESTVFEATSEAAAPALALRSRN